MRQRNMVYTGPMMDTEIEHAYLHPEPYSGHGPLSTRITFMAAPRVVPFVPHNQLPFPGHQVTNGPDDEFKGKITEGFHVNFQYSYPTPGSAPFVVPEYIGFNVIPVVLNQTTGAVDLNIGLQFIPMSHDALGQPVQVVPVPAPWLDQHFFPNFPGMPYMQGYTNGNPVTYMHQPLPPMPQLQPMPRFVQPTPPTGFRVYQPHDQELVIESNSRNHGLPHLRALPEAEVAMFNFANYGHRIDQHRDMRLDIDHMSYEELLALGEQIGNAGSGLSQDFILGHLKMRIFTSSNMLDATSSDQNTNLCTICQMDYNDQEKIGMLECNHEYHVECIEKWLVEKNSCPVCKCTGLAIQGTKS